MNNDVPSETMIALVTRALNTENGLEIQFPSDGAATHWRQRYYKVRARILREQPDSDWRSLTCLKVGTCLRLVPVDSQLKEYVITEL
jgi:hypothetical protein